MADITVKLPNLANQTAIVNALNKIAQQTLDVRSLVSQAVKDNWKTIYPVGSIYVSVSSTSPASLFGGSWEQIKDRFLLAAGSTYGAGTTGGEAAHKLTVNEMPAHSHTYTKGGRALTIGVKNYAETTSGFTSGGVLWSNIPKASDYLTDTGGGAAHSNMPPYLAAYMWKRIS